MQALNEIVDQNILTERELTAIPKGRSHFNVTHLRYQSLISVIQIDNGNKRTHNELISLPNSNKLKIKVEIVVFPFNFIWHHLLAVGYEAVIESRAQMKTWTLTARLQIKLTDLWHMEGGLSMSCSQWLSCNPYPESNQSNFLNRNPFSKIFS